MTIQEVLVEMIRTGDDELIAFAVARLKNGTTESAAESNSEPKHRRKPVVYWQSEWTIDALNMLSKGRTYRSIGRKYHVSPETARRNMLLEIEAKEKAVK